jgi:hypothetical protein
VLFMAWCLIKCGGNFAVFYTAEVLPLKITYSLSVSEAYDLPSCKAMYVVRRESDVSEEHNTSIFRVKE